MVTSGAVAPLADLLATSARLGRDAEYLVAHASAVCRRAAQVSATTRIHREERQEWAALLSSIPLDPDHMVVLCAYCHRVRAPHGWIELPPGIEHQLIGWGGAMVSHGYCPDCLQQHTPPDRPAFRTQPPAAEPE